MPGVVHDGSSLVSKGLVSCLRDDHAIDLLGLRLTAREEAQAAEPSCPFRNVSVADTDNSGGLARRIACRLSYTLRSELTSTPRSVVYESGRRARAITGIQVRGGRVSGAAGARSAASPLPGCFTCQARCVASGADGCVVVGWAWVPPCQWTVTVLARVDRARGARGPLALRRG